MKMTIDRFNDTVSRFVWQAMIPDLDGWGMCVLGGLERLGALRVEGRKLDALRLVGIAVESGDYAAGLPNDDRTARCIPRFEMDFPKTIEPSACNRT